MKLLLPVSWLDFWDSNVSLLWWYSEISFFFRLCLLGMSAHSKTHQMLSESKWDNLFPLTEFIWSFNILVGRYIILVRSGVGQGNDAAIVSSPAESRTEIVWTPNTLRSLHGFNHFWNKRWYNVCLDSASNIGNFPGSRVLPWSAIAQNVAKRHRKDQK